MSDIWDAVDTYLTATVVNPDPGFAAVRRATVDAGLPPIEVSAPHGKLLHLLARVVGARRILEIGTLAGYSATWLARALPADGVLVTLELDAWHAEVATRNVEQMNVASLVDIRVGPAAESLAQLVAEQAEPFDLVFIDADKASIPEYVEWAVRLAHPGTVIVVDNVVRNGRVLDADSDDPNVQGVRRMNELLASHPRLDATTIQTVGSKGYDGFTLAVVS